jgi:hypothetical protein
MLHFLSNIIQLFICTSVKFYMVNVNEVPGALVKRGGIQVSTLPIEECLYQRRSLCIFDKLEGVSLHSPQKFPAL